MEYPFSTDDGWRTIRALRHSPPGNAKRGEGKLLFTAATKQAEQFFRLSDRAGYETKPILLYYGLNQASRAIGAALDEPSSWRPKGHGLRCPNVDDTDDLASMTVMDAGRGSFQKLGDLTGSPTLGGGVSMRNLWACVLEGAQVLLSGSEDIWVCAMWCAYAIPALMGHERPLSCRGLPCLAKPDRAPSAASGGETDEALDTE